MEGYFSKTGFTPQKAIKGQIDPIEGKQTLQDQIVKIRDQWKKSKETSEDQKRRFQELLNLNKILTEGYQHNLNVIIEISQLLLEYRMFIDEIAKSMKDMDSTYNGIATYNDLTHLKSLTTDKLANVAGDFGKQIDKIKKVSQENGMDTSEIEKAKETLMKLSNEKVQEKIQNQLRLVPMAQQKGKGKEKGKEKVKRVWRGRENGSEKEKEINKKKKRQEPENGKKKNIAKKNNESKK